MSGLSQVPVWVWPLAVGLIWVSVISTRDRRTPLVVVYGLPLLVVLSLRTVAGFSVGPWVWTGFLAGYGIGAMIGWRMQEAGTIAKSARWVEQRGEYMTGLVIAVLFGVNVALGFVGAIMPEALAGGALPVVVSGILGLASGTFGGRAFYVAIRPVAGRPPVARAPQRSGVR